MNDPILISNYLLKMCHWTDNWRPGVIVPDVAVGKRLRLVTEKHIEYFLAAKT